MGARLARKDRLVREGISSDSTRTGSCYSARVCCANPSEVSCQLLLWVAIVTCRRLRLNVRNFHSCASLKSSKSTIRRSSSLVTSTCPQSTDPYLDDHRFQGNRLLPAVIGLEAMAQAAAAVLGSLELSDLQRNRIQSSGCCFRNCHSADQTCGIGSRAGLGGGSSSKCGNRIPSRSLSSDFANLGTREMALVKCARWHFGSIGKSGAGWRSIPRLISTGNILFQTGRFQRVDNYRHLNAQRMFRRDRSRRAHGHGSFITCPTACFLGIQAPGTQRLHAIQACIPHRTLLPVSGCVFHFRKANNED